MFQVSKIVSVLWSTFAPEKAKIEVRKVLKDLVVLLVLLSTTFFILGILFFAGMYFLAQWLLLHINHPVICYLISATVAMFITLALGILVLGYVILRFKRRFKDKEKELLEAFSIKNIKL